MNKPFYLKQKLFTNHNEKRISINHEKDEFEVILEGYFLFPVEEEINISKEENKTNFGKATIKKIIWENEKTTVRYVLNSLNSVN